MLKAKLHHARIIHTELHYEGSCAIDEDLLDAVGILVNEQIQIYNLNNANRFTTYAIPAPRGSRIISVNGAAALLANIDDRVIICAYAMYEQQNAKRLLPKVAILDANNSIVPQTSSPASMQSFKAYVSPSCLVSNADQGTGTGGCPVIQP
jgi:aspartate 1-decarboxylase